ncbi:MAG: redoxin domain-containing protein [Planctomycetes bacterium]|nr:redoxin domain-containing protein [Planctomycetota bacterium]
MKHLVESVGRIIQSVNNDRPRSHLEEAFDMRFVLSAIAAFTFAFCTAGFAHAQAEPSQAKLGEKMPNLTFKDEKGKVHRLYELENQKAIAIVFLSFECPVSKSYSEPLSEIAREFGKFGVTIWGLTTNEDETAADVAKAAKQFDLAFPVFKDERLRAAHALHADITPEVFVLDGNFVLRYRGRIDDMYSERLKKHARINEYNLRQTLAELVTGRPVSKSATRAVGCTIPREERPIAKDGAVTYYRDVQPILQNHCQQCHRPGEVGPFSLMTYKQAVNWAKDIKDYTQRREMPPWKVSEGIAFHNERRLANREIKTLADWADNGMPQGDPNDAPKPREFGSGWQLGKPDVILAPDGEFVLGPSGRDVFRCFVLPTKFSEEKYVAAVEMRPGNPQIVHHLILLIDTGGNGRALEKSAQEKEKNSPVIDPHTGEVSKYDRGPGYSRMMGVGFIPRAGMLGWAPGIQPRYMPEGVGFRVPKNADIVMQVHYHRNGRVEKDRTQIGLYFAKKKVDHPFQAAPVTGGSGSGPLRYLFSIPAGAENFKLDGDAYALSDFTLLSITPHMHLLGKSISLTMTPPDGKTQTLIAIKQWDFNWQEMYALKEPIRVKAGTKFHVDAVYDNSDKNPMNPSSPPRRVTIGEQTTNEMCFVFLGGYSDTRLPILPLSPLPPLTSPAK